MYLQTVQLHQGLTQSGRSSVVNVLAQSTQFPGFHPQRNTHTSTHTYNNKVSSASIWVCLPNVCCPLQTRLSYSLIHISRETLHFPAVLPSCLWKQCKDVVGNTLPTTHSQALRRPLQIFKGFLQTCYYMVAYLPPPSKHWSQKQSLGQKAEPWWQNP